MENSAKYGAEGSDICTSTEDKDRSVAVAMAAAASLEYPQDDDMWIVRSEAAKLKYDLELQTAIAESIQEIEISQMGVSQMGAQMEAGTPEPRRDSEGMGSSSEAQSSGTKVSAPPTIDARIKYLSHQLAFEVALVYDPQGDTYIYIDPPARQPEQDYLSYERYVERYKNPILMKSKTLLGLNSPIFNKKFGPTYQHRVIRRRELLNKLPGNVKFVIDLTPPTEGDEAVYLTTELYCAEGVMKWYQAGQRWSIGKAMIGGRDENSLGADMQFDQSSHKIGQNLATSADQQNARSGSSESAQIEYIPLEASATFKHQSELLPEYSPVRHRCAIRRVLAVIQGIDPQLDSAPKVWTTFVVGKYFGVAHSLLTDYIVRWLRAFPNSYFIEVMPEISFRIADGLQCYDLYRDTFAILVGEEALEIAHRDGQIGGNMTTVYGRKRTELPEALRTSLEYASKAFVDRMNLKFMSLVNDEMRWVENLPEFRNLYGDKTSSTNELQSLLRLQKLLKEYIKCTIHTVACKEYDYMPGPKQGFSGGYDLFPRASWAKIWDDLVPRERILTRTFWRALSECVLFEGPTSFCIGKSATFSATYEITGAQTSLRQKNIAREIRKIDLERLAIDLAVGYDGTDASATSGSNGATPPGGMEVLPIIGGTSEAVEENVLRKDDQQDENWSLTGGNISDNTIDGDGEMPQIGSTSCTSGVSSKGFVSNNNSYGKAAGLMQAEHEAGISHGFSFDLDKLFIQASIYLHSFASVILSSPDASSRTDVLELGLTNTLVCLTDSEWKYLPLWAGGNDDDSGGVFTDEVPMSHDGFSTAGPKVRTGSAPSNGSSSDSFTILGSLPSSSNFHTSAMANDGYSDNLPRGRAVPDDDEIATLKSVSSVRFDSDNGHGLMTPTEEEEKEEERAKRTVENMEALEEEIASGKEDDEGFEHVLDDLIEDDDSDDTNEAGDSEDDDDTINGDHDDDEDNDMVLV